MVEFGTTEHCFKYKCAWFQKQLYMVSNMTWLIWWIFTQSLKSLKISFQCALFVKVYKVWAKKIQRSYVSWHKAVMQNLNKPWPCGFKNGKRNLGEFSLATFFPKEYYIWAKKYRGVMCHNTEEWWKMWVGIGLSFEKWHEKIGKFWPDTQKSQSLYFNSGWAFSGLLIDLGIKPVTYPTVIKLGTVIPYLKKIQKLYESRS